MALNFKHLALRRVLKLLLLTVACFVAAAVASPERAAQKAKQRTGGQVLTVKPSTDPQRPGYFVRVLYDDGRVRVVHISP